MGTASASYLKPVVGVFIGYTFMSESLAWTGAAGLIAILLGVAAINHRGLSGTPSWFAPKPVMTAPGTS
jgi:drug/metabolite transporter (DMT)-like permease